MVRDNMLHAEVRQTEGLTFVARGPSNHWVVLDTSESGGGHGAGSSPLELLLMALGGCTGMDVVSILAKMKESYVDSVSNCPVNVRRSTRTASPASMSTTS